MTLISLRRRLCVHALILSMFPFLEDYLDTQSQEATLAEDTTTVLDMDLPAAAVMVLRTALRVDMRLFHPDFRHHAPRMVAVCLHLTDQVTPVTLGPRFPRLWQNLLHPPRSSL